MIKQKHFEAIYTEGLTIYCMNILTYNYHYYYNDVSQQAH